MEFLDIRKMPVSLWRNGAGETREICCFPPATRDFFWRASIASIASNGEFSAFPGVDRVITLLEGGEVTLDAGRAFCHTLKHHQPYRFAGDLAVKAVLTEGQMSMDFNIMTRRDCCRGKGARCYPNVHYLRVTRWGGLCLKWRLGNWATNY